MDSACIADLTSHFVRHPEKSFLAMRLLRQTMSHYSPYEWNHVFNYCIETITTLATSLQSDLEWDSVDDILNKCVKEYVISSLTKYSVDLLGKVVQTIIRSVTFKHDIDLCFIDGFLQASASASSNNGNTTHAPRYFNGRDFDWRPNASPR